MATRSRTVPYPFVMRTATLNDATRHEFAAITVTLPETASRVVTSAWVEITAIDAQSATATRASLSAWTIGIKLGSAAFADTTVTQTITDTGEQTSIRLIGPEWASYFGTNFGTGATQTAQVAFEFDSSSTTNPVIFNNITAILWITYEYDDSAQDTLLAHIVLPFDSPTGGLTDTLTEIGTNQVPDLDEMLVDLGSKSYKSIWFEIQGNESNTATTDYQFAVALDSETEVAFGTVEQACNSSRDCAYTWIRNDLDTTTAHAFKARVTTSGATYHRVRVLLHVVLTYSLAGSTKIPVQRKIPITLPNASGNISGSTYTEPKRWRHQLWISEPGTPALLQSGLSLSFLVGTTASNPLVAVGSQSPRTYNGAIGTTRCGQQGLGHRVDSGAAAGTGITLGAAGTATTITVDFGSGSPYSIVGVTGWLYLLYLADKPTAGEGVCARSTERLVLPHGTAYSVDHTIASQACATIPEASPLVESCGIRIAWCGTPGASYQFIELAADSGEYLGDGWAMVGATYAPGPPEVGVWELVFDCGPCGPGSCWRRFPGDLDSRRLDAEAARAWRIPSDGLMSKGVVATATYHAHTFRHTATIRNSGGGTVTCRLCDAATGEALLSATRTGDGDVTFDWGDARPCYVEAREDATHLGRSETLVGERVTS